MSPLSASGVSRSGCTESRPGRPDSCWTVRRFVGRVARCSLLGSGRPALFGPVQTEKMLRSGRSPTPRSCCRPASGSAAPGPRLRSWYAVTSPRRQGADPATSRLFRMTDARCRQSVGRRPRLSGPRGSAAMRSRSLGDPVECMTDESRTVRHGGSLRRGRPKGGGRERQVRRNNRLSPRRPWPCRPNRCRHGRRTALDMVIT